MKNISRLITRLVISGWLLSAAPATAENLKSAVILDSYAYTPGELFELYRPYLGKPVIEETAVGIAAALRKKYSDDGLARPGYTIPDRGLQSGIVRIRVTEARISRVEFGGDAGPFAERLQRIFGGLESNESLRPDKVRQALKHARRLRGLDVNVRTVADKDDSGAFVMQVHSAYSRMAASVKLSNRGTREIGRNLAFATLAGNGLIGSDSTAGLFLASARHSRDYRNAGAFLNAPAGPNGTTLEFRASTASLQINSSGTLVGQSRDRYSFKITRPLHFDSLRDLSVWTGLDMDNLDVRQDGTVTREDRLRSIKSGVSTNWRGDSSVNLITFETELGINGLDSRLDDFNDPNDAREKNYAIATLHYVHLNELSDNWVLRWDGYGQHSPHVLPSIKRFKVGGNRIGRGFEAAAASGDRGAGNKLELQRRVDLGPSGFALKNLYTFYDLGSTWRNDSTGRESAASAGVGCTIRGDFLSAYLEIAKPLTHGDADGERGVGIFVEMSASF